MPSSSLLVRVLDGCSWCVVNLWCCPRQLNIDVLQSSCCSLRSELNPYCDYIAILLQQLISLVFCNCPLQNISLVTANSICCANYSTNAWCKYVEAVLSIRSILNIIYKCIVSLEFRLTHINLSENLALNLIPCDSLYAIQGITCTTYSIILLDTIRFNSFRSCIYICNFNLDVTNRSNSITRVAINQSYTYKRSTTNNLTTSSVILVTLYLEEVAFDCCVITLVGIIVRRNVANQLILQLEVLLVNCGLTTPESILVVYLIVNIHPIIEVNTIHIIVCNSQDWSMNIFHSRLCCSSQCLARSVLLINGTLSSNLVDSEAGNLEVLESSKVRSYECILYFFISLLDSILVAKCCNINLIVCFCQSISVSHTEVNFNHTIFLVHLCNLDIVARSTSIQNVCSVNQE